MEWRVSHYATVLETAWASPFVKETEVDGVGDGVDDPGGGGACRAAAAVVAWSNHVGPTHQMSPGDLTRVVQKMKMIWT